MPLPYRTVLHLPPQTNLIGLVEQEVQTWLESRGKVDPDRRGGFIDGSFFSPGVHDLGHRRTLSVARLEDGQADARRILLRYLEPNAAGQWQVDVLALDSAEGATRSDTLVIEATRVDDPDAPGEVDPPAFVKQLLGREEVWDSRTPVTSEPRLVGLMEVDDVFQAITDPNRSVSVIVAASLSPDTDTNLRAIMSSLTSKLVGAASVFVLVRTASDELNARLPDSHRLEEGRVRTYLPHVDLDSPADGRRHRVLGPKTFVHAIQGKKVAAYLQAAFAIQTRTALLAEPFPRSLRRWKNALEDELARVSREEFIEQQFLEAREEARREAATVHILPGANPLVARITQLVSRWLGRAKATADVGDIDAIDELLERGTLESRATVNDLERAEANYTSLQLAHETLRENYEYQGLELADAERDVTKLHDQVRYLQRELAKSGNAAAYAQADEIDWSTPSDLGELALVLNPEVSDHPAVSLVVFTGDLDNVTETQLRDQNGLYAQRCWDFVRVLYDYAQLRSQGAFEGNVHSYLQSPEHDGTKVAITRHAPSESKQTIDRWGDERVFPVPADCNPEEQVPMYAHFKAGQENTYAPRLHYYDDTANTGKIYIGYIGKHLSNTKTQNA